jgi:hypothetical protein
MSVPFSAPSVLRIRGLFDTWFRDPGWVKNQDEMHIPDHFRELKNNFLDKILNFLMHHNLFDPGSGMEKNSDPG